MILADKECTCYLQPDTTLQQLWYNLLHYCIYLNHILLDEHHWSSFRGNALEPELSSLVDTHVRNLLCAIMQYAVHAGVKLEPAMMDSAHVLRIAYTTPDNIMLSDSCGFVTVNSFETDFLAFAEAFFHGYNERYVEAN